MLPSCGQNSNPFGCFSSFMVIFSSKLWLVTPCWCSSIAHAQMHMFQYLRLKGALDKYNIILQLFPAKGGIFISLEVWAWVMIACWVWRSRLIYFRRNMNISSILYFSKSTSINAQYSSLWDTLQIMLFTKYLKMKMHWQNQLKIAVLVSFKNFFGIRYKKIDVTLVQCPCKHICIFHRLQIIVNVKKCTILYKYTAYNNFEIV